MLGPEIVFVGLDVGTKTIGVARATPAARLAQPWWTVRRKGVKKDAAALIAGTQGRQVQCWVVGVAIQEDGTEGRSARLARQIGAALAALSDAPVHYIDEGFTTLAASERLRRAGLDSRQQRGLIDQAAAAVILQDWLDQTTAR